MVTTKTSNGVRKLIKLILDFICPQFCLACRREGYLCCPDCRQSINILSANDQPWPNQRFHFSHCYVSTNYSDDVIVGLIKAYKYKYLKNISDLLVDILYQKCQYLKMPANTIVTYIPLHNRKRRQRGFDQSQVLAQKLAKRLSLDYAPLLARQRYTRSQAQLDRADRLRNMAGAFTLHDSAILGKQPVLLIDDITSTGATLDHASKVLCDNGFGDINCLVLAKNDPCQN